jgi:hypothetical protein
MNRKVISMLFLTSAISATKLGENTKRLLQDDSDIPPSQYRGFEEPDLTGLAFEDIDVSNIDWMNFDFENFDFSTVEWGDNGWEDLFAGHDYNSWSICPSLKAAIGLENGFGIAAKCTCDGATTIGMGITCKYDACLFGLCGSVQANFAFTNFGSVLASGCFDLANDAYKQICFGYKIPLANIFAPITCSASYGGMACECERNAFCLSVDCSKYLPGLKMDHSCQLIRIKDEEDTRTFVPHFAIFDKGFNGYRFADIDWQKLDWENLNWENFSLDQVNWENTDFAMTTWRDIFSDEMSDGLVCPILSQVIADMSEDLDKCGVNISARTSKGDPDVVPP